MKQTFAHAAAWFQLGFAQLPATLLAILLVSPAVQAQSGALFRMDSDGITQALAPAGDAARGRALLISRDPANCILCHGLTDPAVRSAGNLAPPLDGAGSRLTPAQLRLRIADSSRINPATIMPSYFKTDGFTAVATQYAGKTVLSAQQVEDLVVYLSTLK
jgi:L-cysteine S-thiosulfotransferase